MSKVQSSRQAVSDRAVVDATGFDREHWYALLDLFGTAKKGHKATADFLHDEHGVSFWWAQQITVDYEQHRGLRKPGQRSDGKFTVNISKTIAAPVARVFDAWSNAAAWNKWFTAGAKVEFREGGAYSNNDSDHGKFLKIVPPGGPLKAMNEAARLQFTWENAQHSPGSVVTVQFLEKGDAKSGVAITHDKLKDENACSDMKEGWQWALSSLKSFLETGAPIRHETWKAERDAR